ncbi:MAG TPA: lipopolysaccharide heptosyltransferase I [Arenicellales bacterium]|nr:lipopolysaccharide heptosyltransferase I [Arenicellales bacterium]
MKLLLVKTTSFGDLLHTFPALNDAWRSIDKLECDWLVEAPYAVIPTWHPAVRHVIPVSMRAWRRPPWLQHIPAIRRFARELRRERYDLIIDAQGLLKSALLARLARGRRLGYGRHSIREPAASRFYDDTVEVEDGLHAVDRARALFAAAMGYEIPGQLDYGLVLPQDAGPLDKADRAPYLVFIPGTTWPSKRWPLGYWRELAERAAAGGWRVEIAAGSEAELRDAHWIAERIDGVDARSGLSLEQLARLLAGARATVSVDSGPGHLAAAVGTPGVSIYGATDAGRTGIRGPGQLHLSADFPCSPCLRRQCQFPDRGQVYPDCYETVPPQRVWSTLHGLIQEHGES